MTIQTETLSQVETLKTKYEQAGQGQVFQFYDELNVEEKARLMEQLLEIDVERVNSIYQKAIQASTVSHHNEQVEPLTKDVFDTILTDDEQPTNSRKRKYKDIQDWETLGLSLIAKNQVAVILMAGGQGTRLGSSAPKGCYDINLPSKKSLFQLQAERILRLQEVAQQYALPQQQKVIIPWYIMTSGPTHQPTVDFFKQHQFFGLDEKNITFFEQGTLPCLTMDGKIIMESKGKVAIAPDGNGGIYAAVQNKGVIEDLKRRGILYTHCYCVDNCLAKVADPVFVGYCVSKETDCGVKVVRKTKPDEPVGVVCRRGGRYGVVEYSEISKELSEKRDPEDGGLMLRAANIVNHFFSTAFLERVPEFAGELEYHIAKKKIKHVDISTGETVVPTSNSGMKLECFVFDVFPFSQHFSVLEVDRKEEFSPLKNAPGTGVDCPETSRRDLISQHIRFVQAAGGTVKGVPSHITDASQIPDDCHLEISPWVSYAGEGLSDVVNGKVVVTPAVIETRQDLIKVTHH
ncbi:nucleotide-diphospho-sugar transferase [Halteromyces radiatus]|uniref:nucleotide-diphospho-sugar transferase n=1 Tax=Halteromyces radiatus TaxID=101107 RepID=UPI00221F002D|nr:nucleotide-diphospho-sugar transferase [Halteromyces radiatus]KAI8092984.1 nucleotide-diphospho-sugar transferase [Halteromyces radiatus]